MHSLHRIKVTRAYENEIAGHRFGFYQCARRPVGLSGDGHLLLLHGSEQGLLGLCPEGVDLIDVEDTFVGPVDISRLQPLVGGGFETSGLVRIVADVSEKGT